MQPKGAAWEARRLHGGRGEGESPLFQKRRTQLTIGAKPPAVVSSDTIAVDAPVVSDERGPWLSLADHAALSLEIALAPQETAAIEARFGITAAGRAALDALGGVDSLAPSRLERARLVPSSPRRQGLCL